MSTERTEELREQVFRLCEKLIKMRPSIQLNTQKADETLRFWLPEMTWGDIERYKQEFLKKTEA